MRKRCDAPCSRGRRRNSLQRQPRRASHRWSTIRTAMRKKLPRIRLRRSYQGVDRSLAEKTEWPRYRARLFCLFTAGAVLCTGQPARPTAMHWADYYAGVYRVPPEFVHAIIDHHRQRAGSGAVARHLVGPFCYCGMDQLCGLMRRK
jgi:hypothetical protein